MHWSSVTWITETCYSLYMKVQSAEAP